MAGGAGERGGKCCAELGGRDGGMHLEVVARASRRRIEGDELDLVEVTVGGDGDLLRNYSAWEREARGGTTGDGSDDDGLRLNAEYLPLVLAGEGAARPERDDEGAEVARFLGDKVDGRGGEY